MGSTNKTAHYELPQFVANDKPSWLGDVNEAMEAIDTGIYGAKSSADGAQQTANNAVAGVQSAGTRMDGIQTQLDTVATQANQTATTVTGHTSSIATNSANINTLNSRMGSTDISAIGDGTVTGAISAISQGGGGGGSASKTVKGTTTPNTKYSAQMAELEALFDTLTAEQKRECYIVNNGGDVFRIADVPHKMFSIFKIETNPFLSNLDVDNHKVKTWSGTGSPYDASNDTYSGYYSLYA